MSNLNKYDHGGDIYSRHVELDFSVNVNPLGMPQAAKLALAECIPSCETYPDPLCRRLRGALSDFLGVPQGALCFGNGAADVIIRLCMAVRPRTVLVCAPTFSEYEKGAGIVGARVEKHLLSSGNDFDLGADALETLERVRPDLFFVCNPNNPTGRVAPPELMARLAQKCDEMGAVFAVDECFLSFTGAPSVAPLMRAHRSLVIIDAFTKIYAMAGLRLGWLMSANDALLARVADMGQSWAVSTPAQAAGLAALSAGREWLESTRRFVREETAFVRRGLKDLGCRVVDGAANYTLFRCGAPLDELLIRRGILIRSCANYTGLDASWFRVGLKRRAENEILLNAIKLALR